MRNKSFQILMISAFLGIGFLGSTTAYSISPNECYFNCGDKQEDCVVWEYIGYQNKHWKKICEEEFRKCIDECPSKI